MSRPGATSHDHGAPTAQQQRHPLVQLVVFAGVGGLLNVLYAGLYLALRQVWDTQPANAVALVVSTLIGTYTHRRISFGVRHTSHRVVQQLLGIGLLLFSLAVTAGSLEVLVALSETPSRTAEVVVLVAANLGCGLVRFALFRVAMLPRDVRRRRAAAA